MASQGKAVVVVVLLCAMAMAVSAGVYSVGGESGWTYGSPKTITVAAGDKLRFLYPANEHDVWQVSAEVYKSCQSVSAYAKYNSGDDYVLLPSPGTYYFICSVAGHCDEGMKLAVTAN